MKKIYSDLLCRKLTRLAWNSWAVVLISSDICLLFPWTPTRSPTGYLASFWVGGQPFLDESNKPLVSAIVPAIFPRLRQVNLDIGWTLGYYCPYLFFATWFAGFGSFSAKLTFTELSLGLASRENLEKGSTVHWEAWRL